LARRDQANRPRSGGLHRLCAAKRCTLKSLLYQSADVRPQKYSTSDGWATLGARSPITPPEVEMTRIKSRLYSPALLTAITVLAASGAAFRIG
jgi:hypothetical protein